MKPIATQKAKDSQTDGKKSFPNGRPQLRRMTREEIDRYRIGAYEPMFY